MYQVAAKFEKKEHVSPQLRHEYKVYRELKGSRGICSVSVDTVSSAHIIPSFTSTFVMAYVSGSHVYNSFHFI